jgi:hypothetical protein
MSNHYKHALHEHGDSVTRLHPVRRRRSDVGLLLLLLLVLIVGMEIPALAEAGLDLLIFLGVVGLARAIIPIMKIRRTSLKVPQLRDIIPMVGISLSAVVGLILTIRSIAIRGFSVSAILLLLLCFELLILGLSIMWMPRRSGN